MTRILTFGVAVADFVLYVDAFPTAPEKYRARDAEVVGGGCASSAAVAIARLGGEVEFAGRLGRDAVGDMILSGLEAEGVGTSLVNRSADGRSSFSSVLVDPAGERQIMNFRGSGLAEDTGWIALPDGIDAVLADNRWQPGARATLAQARARGVPAVVDAEAPLAFDDIADASHVAFSMQGLRSLYPGRAPQEALIRVRADHGGWTCVTDGANGVWYNGPAGAGHVPAFSVTPIDTLGAGDVWHGAFTLRLAEGAGEVDAIRFANAAAAIKCTRRGGRAGAPDRAETLRFLGEMSDATHSR